MSDMKINSFMKVRFNHKKAISDLIKRMVLAVNDFAEEYLVQAYRTQLQNAKNTDAWVRGENSNQSLLVDSISKKIIDVGKTEIVAIVGSDNWRSFIAEYGMGSEMANLTENPDLAQYVNKFWHSERPLDGTITTKQGGTSHTHPDWDKGDGYTTDHIEAGRVGGIDLEKIGAKFKFKNGRTGIAKVKPLAPNYSLNNVFEDLKRNGLNNLKQKIENVYQTFDWDNYFVLKNR